MINPPVNESAISAQTLIAFNALKSQTFDIYKILDIYVELFYSFAVLLASFFFLFFKIFLQKSA